MEDPTGGMWILFDIYNNSISTNTSSFATQV